MYVSDATKRYLRGRYDMTPEDVDGYAVEYLRVYPQGTEDEFLCSVEAWFQDGTSHFYDRYLVSGAEIAQAYLIGYGDAEEGQGAEPEAAVEYIGPDMAPGPVEPVEGLEDFCAEVGEKTAQMQRQADMDTEKGFGLLTMYHTGWIDALAWATERITR